MEKRRGKGGVFKGDFQGCPLTTWGGGVEGEMTEFHELEYRALHEIWSSTLTACEMWCIKELQTAFARTHSNAPAENRYWLVNASLEDAFKTYVCNK